jgi:ribosomal protein S18 acetylase RimI-like enzyme
MSGRPTTVPAYHVDAEPAGELCKSPRPKRQDCQVTVTLRQPDADEYAAWNAAAFSEYVEEIVASGGMSREAAEERARREDAELLPDGWATPGQLIFRVEADGQSVGWLWLALQSPRAETGVGFIYDITIDEALRGRGYGRRAMQLAEEEARRHGIHALALNVFGQNAIARALYSSLGYRETSVQMRKEL